MSEDCIFCAIVSGDQPGHVVYEDDSTVAFLDANPLAPGHTLVVPRDHHERVQDMPDDVARDVFRTIHRLVPRIEDAVDADATNVGFNNGETAGQVVPHVHGHVVPRFEGDGGRPIHAVAASQEDLDDDELAAIAEDVRSAGE
ncbi:HIT family protein [Halobacteriales archaeon QS_1_68_20]|nr:MAG: HIT family protein [Halobacteriales archaeon QS_1_68_20]